MNPAVFRPQQISPRTQRLHEELEGTIRRFRDCHPELEDGEIRHALALSGQSLNPHSTAVMAAVAGALVLVFTGAMIYLF